jgi:hypothetical protein
MWKQLEPPSEWGGFFHFFARAVLRQTDSLNSKPAQIAKSNIAVIVFL